MIRSEDKEFLDLMAQGIRAEIKAGNDMLKMQIGGIIERQDKANHRTNKLEEFFIKLHDDEMWLRNGYDGNRKDIDIIKEQRDKIIKKQWIYLIGGVVVASILAALISDIGLLEFIKLVK